MGVKLDIVLYFALKFYQRHIFSARDFKYHQDIIIQNYHKYIYCNTISR